MVVARDGRLPVGADEAVAEAGGTAVVVVGRGSRGRSRCTGGRRHGVAGPTPARGSGRHSSPSGWLRSSPAPLVVLPASPDGRDLAPRLAAALDRPLVARAIEVRVLRPSRNRTAADWHVRPR